MKNHDTGHPGRPAGLDDEAFLRVFRERGQGLLGYFARRTFDPHVAADLTAETFAVAYQSRAKFDPSRGEPGAWLYGIAQHLLGSYRRTFRVERTARDRLRLPDRPLSSEDCDRIEQLIDFEAVGRQVAEALRELAVDQREAVSLRVVDGLSYEQVAVRVGCSQEVARARVSRGLRQLAELLPAADDLEGTT